MAGHSHWAGIKHKKEAIDIKRGKVFSKLLRAVTIAAKREPNPDFNPRLRTAVEKARLHQVPADAVARALRRAKEAGEDIEEIVIECYGPGGAAIIAKAITDSKNRTVAEVRKIIGDNGGKWAEPGAVRWAFRESSAGDWEANFPLTLAEEDRAGLSRLIEALEEYEDVETVATNAENL